MKLILAAIGAVLALTACGADSKGDSVHTLIEADVESSTYEMRRFIDSEYGVACYYAGFRMLSCIKVR